MRIPLAHAQVICSDPGKDSHGIERLILDSPTACQIGNSIENSFEVSGRIVTGGLECTGITVFVTDPATGSFVQDPFFCNCPTLGAADPAPFSCETPIPLGHPGELNIEVRLSLFDEDPPPEDPSGYDLEACTVRTVGRFAEESRLTVIGVSDGASFTRRISEGTLSTDVGTGVVSFGTETLHSKQLTVCLDRSLSPTPLPTCGSPPVSDITLSGSNRVVGTDGDALGRFLTLTPRSVGTGDATCPHQIAFDLGPGENTIVLEATSGTGPQRFTLPPIANDLSGPELCVRYFDQFGQPIEVLNGRSLLQFDGRDGVSVVFVEMNLGPCDGEKRLSRVRQNLGGGGGSGVGEGGGCQLVPPAAQRGWQGSLGKTNPIPPAPTSVVKPPVVGGALPKNPPKVGGGVPVIPLEPGDPLGQVRRGLQGGEARSCPPELDAQNLPPCGAGDEACIQLNNETTPEGLPRLRKMVEVSGSVEPKHYQTCLVPPFLGFPVPVFTLKGTEGVEAGGQTTELVQSFGYGRVAALFDDRGRVIPIEERSLPGAVAGHISEDFIQSDLRPMIERFLNSDKFKDEMFLKAFEPVRPVEGELACSNTFEDKAEIFQLFDPEIGNFEITDLRLLNGNRVWVQLRLDGLHADVEHMWVKFVPTDEERITDEDGDGDRTLDETDLPGVRFSCDPTLSARGERCESAPLCDQVRILPFRMQIDELRLNLEVRLNRNADGELVPEVNRVCDRDGCRPVVLIWGDQGHSLEFDCRPERGVSKTVIDGYSELVFVPGCDHLSRCRALARLNSQINNTDDETPDANVNVGERFRRTVAGKILCNTPKQITDQLRKQGDKRTQTKTEFSGREFIVESFLQPIRAEVRINPEGVSFGAGTMLLPAGSVEAGTRVETSAEDFLEGLPRTLRIARDPRTDRFGPLYQANIEAPRFPLDTARDMGRQVAVLMKEDIVNNLLHGVTITLADLTGIPEGAPPEDEQILDLSAKRVRELGNGTYPVGSEVGRCYYRNRTTGELRNGEMRTSEVPEERCPDVAVGEDTVDTPCIAIGTCYYRQTDTGALVMRDRPADGICPKAPRGEKLLSWEEIGRSSGERQIDLTDRAQLCVPMDITIAGLFGNVLGYLPLASDMPATGLDATPLLARVRLNPRSAPTVKLLWSSAPVGNGSGGWDPSALISLGLELGFSDLEVSVLEATDEERPKPIDWCFATPRRFPTWVKGCPRQPSDPAPIVRFKLSGRLEFIATVQRISTPEEGYRVTVGLKSKRVRGIVDLDTAKTFLRFEVEENNTLVEDGALLGVLKDKLTASSGLGRLAFGKGSEIKVTLPITFPEYPDCSFADAEGLVKDLLEIFKVEKVDLETLLIQFFDPPRPAYLGLGLDIFRHDCPRDY